MRPLPSTTWYCLLLLVLAGLLVYANNYQGEFIFDDFPAIVGNPEVHALSPVGPLIRPSVNSPLSARPVAAISFAFNYAVGGLDVRGYHLVNNLIHLMAALALFGLIRVTLLLPRFALKFGPQANGYALAIALIWLVHPLNSEAVDYLVCRTELLVGLFYLSTMFFAAMAFRMSRSRNWLLAAVVSCALGMGSKEVMVSAPLLVLVYDRLFAAGSFAAALRQRWGFYAALATTWIIVIFYQLDSPHSDGVYFDATLVPVFDYLRTQLTVIVHYLRLCFWPHPLALDSQGWPIIRGFSPALIVPLAILGSFAIATIAGTIKKTWWSILGVWFFAILAPSSSVIPILTEIVAERRMYLPLAAVVVLVVFLADFLWRRLVERYRLGNKTARLVPGLMLAILVSTLGGTTFARNRDYRQGLTIWAATVAERPGNARAHFHLGLALLSEKRWPEAIQSFREVIRHHGDYTPTPEAAMEHKLRPVPQQEHVLICYNRGNSYLMENDLANAAVAFNQAITLDPNFSPAQDKLRLVIRRQAEQIGAEEFCRKVIETEPYDANLYVISADLLSSQQLFEEAAFMNLLGILRGVTPEDEIIGSLERLINEHPETMSKVGGLFLHVFVRATKRGPSANRQGPAPE